MHGFMAKTPETWMPSNQPFKPIVLHGSPLLSTYSLGVLDKRTKDIVTY